MIVFTDKQSYGKAVWEAFIKHLGYMDENEIILLVDNNSFPDYELPSNVSKITYKNRFEAIKIILSYKKRRLFFLNVVDLFRFQFLKYIGRKLFVWHQGIIPEESYSRHNSILRYYILSAIEFLALRNADGAVLVSSEAKSFLERKYKFLSLKKYIIVPCLSDFSLTNISEPRDNKFVYIGGISPWQCFEDVIASYLYIKNVIENATLSIYTLDKEKAKITVEKFTSNYKELGIEIASLTSRNEVEAALNNHRYGFLLRENIPLNNVASPIKFGEYLSCGVAPIITEAVIDYAKIVRKDGIGIISSTDKRTLVKDIKIFDKSPEEIYQSYLNRFNFQQIRKDYKWLLN
tara:strand:- start:3118 stop:4161 length:1044 start_codon:yes stop_codon:yes gene_type:complete